MESIVKEDIQSKVINELKDIIYMASGMPKEDMDADRRLIAFGLDSILLLSVSKQISTRYGIDIPLELFFTTVNTLTLVADHIIENGTISEKVHINTDSSKTEIINDHIEKAFADSEGYEIRYERVPMAGQRSISTESELTIIAEVFRQQYDILLNQTNILGTLYGGNYYRENATTDVMFAEAEMAVTASDKQNINEDYYKPYNRPQTQQNDEFTEGQLKYIQEVQNRLDQKYKVTKNRTQEYRDVYASNRNSAGFRMLYKEMLYQIIAEEAKGSSFIDVDNNKLIDLTMGFGVLLFGHSPDFVRNSLTEEISKGMPVGPMGRLTGEVAKSISALTGVERVFFCNSGTEADMFAVRIARAVTKKNKIVCFKGCFHGTYDGFLGLPVHSDNLDHTTVSLAPGITDCAVGDLIILDFNSDNSLRYIEQHKDIIAAVITEPVQSRRPDIQPKEFLQGLRKVTAENNIALIFDEIITGFRISPGGAQEYFGIKADIVTYGKVIGGGMPIGILAGKREFLDSIDGGYWSYGDESIPPYDHKRTFVAGTFCHHPMAMASTYATLNYINANKNSLYKDLNQKTEQFAAILNQFFESEDVGINMIHFGSLFRFTVNFDKEIFYYNLLSKGIYIWEGRNCFISTEHTTEDLEKVVNSIKETITDMKAAGFFQNNN